MGLKARAGSDRSGRGRGVLGDEMASRQPVAETRSPFPPPSQNAAKDRRELERSLLYSEELGIGLVQGTDDIYFRWFLSSRQ